MKSSREDIRMIENGKSSVVAREHKKGGNRKKQKLFKLLNRRFLFSLWKHLKREFIKTCHWFISEEIFCRLNLIRDSTSAMTVRLRYLWEIHEIFPSAVCLCSSFYFFEEEFHRAPTETFQEINFSSVASSSHLNFNYQKKGNNNLKMKLHDSPFFSFSLWHRDLTSLFFHVAGN